MECGVIYWLFGTSVFKSEDGSCLVSVLFFQPHCCSFIPSVIQPEPFLLLKRQKVKQTSNSNFPETEKWKPAPEIAVHDFSPLIWFTIYRSWINRIQNVVYLFQTDGIWYTNASATFVLMLMLLSIRSHCHLITASIVMLNSCSELLRASVCMIYILK